MEQRGGRWSRSGGDLAGWPEFAVTAPTNLASLTNTPQVSKLSGTSSLGPAVNSSVGNTLVPIAGKDDMKLVTLEFLRERWPEFFRERWPKFL